MNLFDSYSFGSDFLTYTVDGKVVGTQDINRAGQLLLLEVLLKDLGSDKTKSFTYSVVDDLGDEIWGF